MFEIDDRKAGNINRQAVFVAVKSLLFGFQLTVRADTVSAERFVVGIEDHLVCSLLFDAERVVFSCNRSEIADADDFVFALVNSSEYQNGVFIVVADTPLKAVPAVILLPQSGIFLVKLVESLVVVLQFSVLFVAQKQPVKTLVVFPFDKLTEFLTHEHQLLARVSHHVAHERTHTAEFFVIVTGHLVDQRAFSVNNLIVRHGKHKVFGKRIEERKCQKIMIELS